MTDEEREIIYQATGVKGDDREVARRCARPLGEEQARRYVAGMTDAEVDDFLRPYVRQFRERQPA